MLDVFGGYNHNLRIGEGEFYEMTNLSSDNYPILSPRPKRGVYDTVINSYPQGMIAKDSLCYVDGDTFYINKYPVPVREDGKFTLYTECNDCPIKTTCLKYKKDSTHCEKTMISMGAYVIIMPDKKYINTEDQLDYGDIEAKETTTDDITFELCTVEGAAYTDTKAQSTPPTLSEDQKEGKATIPYWIDTSEIPHLLKQYSVDKAMWSTIATTYIKISSPGIARKFALNDGITIEDVEGIDDLSSPTSAVIWAIDESEAKEWIVVKGILDETKTQPASKHITIRRQMPKMDFIIESENRLWGCRYGTALNGQVVNEIYASKLGDFKNWNCFMGISTDSYVASVGTDGQFTGAITHLGYPLFFKETCVHKVYGNYPSNYQIQTTACRGVQKGSGKSLAIVNEVLYYKSRSGICAYDGSLPAEISSALGDIAYSDAVAGALGNKYYVSMKDASNKDHLFVYDTIATFSQFFVQCVGCTMEYVTEIQCLHLVINVIGLLYAKYVVVEELQATSYVSVNGRRCYRLCILVFSAVESFTQFVDNLVTLVYLCDINIVVSLLRCERQMLDIIQFATEQL